MASKDTILALTKRGINEETATLLVSKFHSMSGIADAGVEGLVAAGLTEESAETVIEAIGKRSRSRSSSKKAATPAPEQTEEAPAAPVFEEVVKVRENSEMEQRLIDIGARLGVDLPLKIYVDIAAKIESINFKL